MTLASRPSSVIKEGMIYPIIYPKKFEVPYYEPASLLLKSAIILLLIIIVVRPK